MLLPRIEILGSGSTKEVRGFGYNVDLHSFGKLARFFRALDNTR